MSKSAKDVIKVYLDGMAEKDEAFKTAYENKAKSMDKCFAYIVSEARKRGNAVCMTDEEVFGLAVHYYVEGDINDVKLPDDLESVTMSESKLKSKPKEAVQNPKKQVKRVDKYAGMGSLFDF